MDQQKMKAFLIDAVTELKSMGWGVDLYRGYSGRFMYGKECLGIQVNREQSLVGLATGLVIHAYENEPTLTDELQDLLNSAKTDSLGLGTILYFPQIEDEEDEEGDEDE